MTSPDRSHIPFVRDRVKSDCSSYLSLGPFNSCVNHILAKANLHRVIVLPQNNEREGGKGI